MKKHNIQKITLAGLLLFMTAVMINCTKDAGPSIYDTKYVQQAAPVITSITSNTGYAFAGYSVLTIAGNNFPSDTAAVMVYFDAQDGSFAKGRVLSTAPTVMTVKAPNIVGTGLRVKLFINGVEKTNAPYVLVMVPAIQSFGIDSTKKEESFAITADKLGNIYMSMAISGVKQGIQKIVPNGDRTLYATANFNYLNMRYGRGDTIFCVTGQPALFIIPPATKAEVLWVYSGLGKLNDLDFDASKNIWAGGAGDSIYRIKSDKSVKGFFHKEVIHGVRVFSGSLYVASRSSVGLEKIYKYPITSNGDLGSAEVYFDFSSIYTGVHPDLYTISFAEDGDLYVGKAGVDGTDGVIIIHPNKTTEGLYPGLVFPDIKNFTWGIGTEMYITRHFKNVTTNVEYKILYKLEMQKKGAIDYGRGM